MGNVKFFQVSTLQALMLGYTKRVISVGELLKGGDTGLGTFENVDGEMIVVDGRCFRAEDDGNVIPASPDDGVPFASVAFMSNNPEFSITGISNAEMLKTRLNVIIEENFGINSMHIVRIDGTFIRVMARSEAYTRSQHVELSEILKKTQRDFEFESIEGTVVGLYYPDYMDGINASGWHFHFISKDKKRGGHVFDLSFDKASVRLDKISSIEIRIPNEPAYDTYSLKEVSNDDIKRVEQG